MIYKYSNDDIVKTLLEWKKKYKVELEDKSSREYSMCNDVFNYIIEKYKTYHFYILI